MNPTAETLDLIAAERARRGLTTPLDKIILWASLLMSLGGTSPIRLNRTGEHLHADSDGMIPLYHFGPHEAAHEPTFTTDPGKFGKNPWSSSERKAEGTPKTFFYTDLKDRESFFGGRPLFTARYPADKIYDATKDAEGHAERSRGVTDLIARLKQAGYHGIFYSGVFPTVAMWEPVQMTKHEAAPTKLARVKIPGVNTHGTNERALEDAKAYHEKYGAQLGLQPFSPAPSQLTLTPEHTAKIVAAYDTRKHNPTDPDTAAAYDAFKRETLQQFQHMVSRGLKVHRWDQPGQPYANSQAMRDHVDRDHALYYFPTASGYDAADAATHPVLEQAPGMPPGVLYNDLFRAMHEYFGHAMHGHEFGPKGELRAWHEHAKMYSPLARRALTNETLGQTQWFFHGPHKDKPVPERPFPEQRTALLPREVEPDAKLARGGMAYVSSNTKTGTTMQDAYNMLNSPDHAALVRATPGGKSGYGVWSDGAEDARMFPLSDSAQLPRLADALRTMFKQKSVATFRDDTNGPDTLHVIQTRETDPEKVHRDLLARGIDHKTILASPEGLEVHVLDKGNQIGDKMRDYARAARTYRRYPGHVEFRETA